MDNATCPFYAMEFWEQENYQDKIADGCPLVPVPPHGDLIDKKTVSDNLVSVLNKKNPPFSYPDWNDAVVAMLTAPTIIPAEGKGYILAPQEEYDGLKRKYVVLKSDTGECVENCFVLRPDKDKAAIAALLAYADATDNHVLAKDIRAWISIIPAEEGET